ncbi:hypothetical protein B0A78_00465 [Flavobacterium columnare NBRC 100251 = ATCC 23463]|nr:hypothetical protein [Flavobacterium columnare]PDS27233.1 hypothetical protein B0A78_00465 [Flavobacterium columnare NBRC 100251 = ATCC 23463]MBF6655793.1 hypothetical protein [Flavobacterium columnare]MBF6658647.1 hypothetical protein [Flavobacterium columnare]OOB82439.1 hypothetical protein BZL53_08770 [Flavobacterium columnare]
MVYSTHTICKTRTSFSNWFDSERELNTRILIYNNGRKTLSKKQINKLEITSSDLKEIFIVKGIDELNTSIDGNIVKINFENLDSSEFIVLEVIHKGTINVEGRIDETGKILHTEPRNWVIVNGIIIITLTASLFYNMYTLLEKDLLLCIVNFIFTTGIFIILRFIHSLLFIPDSVSAKYLDAKDKLENEFQNC